MMMMMLGPGLKYVSVPFSQINFKLQSLTETKEVDCKGLIWTASQVTGTAPTIAWKASGITATRQSDIACAGI